MCLYIAGKIVESVAGLSRARYIIKLCRFNIILSDPMDITETTQQKNDYFSQLQKRCMVAHFSTYEESVNWQYEVHQLFAVEYYLTHSQ